jgi:hypothetical protein
MTDVLVPELGSIRETSGFEAEQKPMENVASGFDAV